MKSLLSPTLLLSLTFLLSNCGDSPKPEPQQDSDPEARTSIEMVTDRGTMVLELYNETPKHRDNFISLTNEGAFDSLLFHRVIENFMVQSGDPDSKNAEPGKALGNGDRDYLVDAEMDTSLFHKKGVLAAARDGNPGRGSSAMQFYITQGKVFNDSLLEQSEKRINGWLAEHYVKQMPEHAALGDSIFAAEQAEDWDAYEIWGDSIKSIALQHDFEQYTFPDHHREMYKTVGGTPHLDQSYTIFGEVISGISVVDSIAAVATDSLDRPMIDVRIVSVRVLD